MKCIRKLASVQVISNISPIENADNLVLARVLGWNVVINKVDNLKIGDKVVYFEIDSILPADNPKFTFLLNSKGKMKPLKPKKIRGVVSQGLVMPLSILPEGDYQEGQDVTEALKVTKYEPEVKLSIGKNQVRINTKPFPVFIPKTDEDRVQTIPDLLKTYAGHKFVLTEKLDGTSFTAYVRDGKFGICSRNLEMPLDGTNLYGFVAIKFDLENKFLKLRQALGYDFAMQGELIGSGIQGNKYGFKNDNDIRWYNLFNIDVQKDIGFYFSDTDEYVDFNGITLGEAAALIDMETVPILDSDFTMIDDVDALVDLASSKSLLNPEQNREGIVFRAKYNRQLTKYGERVSFKAINLDFLLAEK